MQLSGFANFKAVLCTLGEKLIGEWQIFDLLPPVTAVAASFLSYLFLWAMKRVNCHWSTGHKNYQRRDMWKHNFLFVSETTINKNSSLMPIVMPWRLLAMSGEIISCSTPFHLCQIVLSHLVCDTCDLFPSRRCRHSLSIVCIINLN